MSPNFDKKTASKIVEKLLKDEVMIKVRRVYLVYQLTMKYLVKTLKMENRLGLDNVT